MLDALFFATKTKTTYPYPRGIDMFKQLLIVGAVAMAPLFAVKTVEAQVYTTVAPPTAVGYIPVRRGLFGLRSDLQPVVVPGAATTVVNRPVVTTNYAPTTTYYTPTTSYYAPTTSSFAPTTSYYTPTTSYYTPEVTTAYYSPPATTTYYAPTSQVVPATTYSAVPTTVNYYPKTYWYSTPAPVPRTVGMPIIGY
ncbi:hypothetical protein C5Y96_12315 [Blastopirellula marina]|uniref:Uncharacterized protein n=2 Tax=Pirellulales TaxID=2691354 RepID=A0A2S8FG44_9BACT|nr:hypothetical protein C5Y96_12315 [Blastopirellula marina]RCS51525.1 hypothetical protein DTL36_12325 [Bremerella cremea]